MPKSRASRAPGSARRERDDVLLLGARRSARSRSSTRRLAELPDPQRRALALALVLEDAEGPPPDGRAVGVAALNALRALAAESALLVAVDDAQWLDSASAAALAYGARRLERRARRPPARAPGSVESALVLELRRSFRSRSLQRRARRAARDGRAASRRSTSTSESLCRAPCSRRFTRRRAATRSTRSRSCACCAARRSPSRRVSHCPCRSRCARSSTSGCWRCRRRAASTCSPRPRSRTRPSRSSRRRAASSATPVSAPLSRPASSSSTGDRIRFTHPLLAAGAYEAADPAAPGPGPCVPRRARRGSRGSRACISPRRSRSRTRTSPRRSRRLRGDARARGAPRAAALLLDRARELTPTEQHERALRRAVDAAYLHFESGDSPRAEAQLRTSSRRLAAGRSRARALMRLARVRSYEAQAEAADLFLQAIEEAEGDREILAVAHEGVATCLFRLRERLDGVGRACGVRCRPCARARRRGSRGGIARHRRRRPRLLLGLGDRAADRGRPSPSSPLRRISASSLSRSSRLRCTADVDRRARVPARAAFVELLRASRRPRRRELAALRARSRSARSSASWASSRAPAPGPLEGQQASEQSGQAHAPRVQPCARGPRRGSSRRGASRPGPPRSARLERRSGDRRSPGRARCRARRSDISSLRSAFPTQQSSRLEPGVAFARREGIAEPARRPLRRRPDRSPDRARAPRGGRRAPRLVRGRTRGGWSARRRLRPAAAAAGCSPPSPASSSSRSRRTRRRSSGTRRCELPLDRARTLARARRRAASREAPAGGAGDAGGGARRLRGGSARSSGPSERGRSCGGSAVAPRRPVRSRPPRSASQRSSRKERRTARSPRRSSSPSARSKDISRACSAKLGVRSRTELARVLASGTIKGVAAPNTGDSPVSPTTAAP